MASDTAGYDAILPGDWKPEFDASPTLVGIPEARFSRIAQVRAREGQSRWIACSRALGFAGKPIPSELIRICSCAPRALSATRVSSGR